MTTKSAAAKKSIVVAVPKVGMKTSIGKNVPKTLPMVEIPKICPAESPTWPLRAMILMRNGLVIPIITIGGEKRSVMAERDPKNMNEKDELKLPMSDASHLTSGDATKGSTRRKAEAAMRSLQKDVEPRLPVGEPSSDKVADRQGNHDNADDICPDKGRRSEKWRHEPRRAKLNGHDTHTGEKGEHINVKSGHVHFTCSGVLLGYIFSLRIPSEASGNPPSHTLQTNRPYRYFQVLEG